MDISSRYLGARYLGNGQTEFRVWAPKPDQVAVHLVAPDERIIPLQPDAQGYWLGQIAAEPGALYFYQLDGTDRPDPASNAQPQGVHGPSEIVDHQFDWRDHDWHNRPLGEMVIYELHVGTFTPEGTFDAIIPRIPELLELGVNAIELMPIAQFPGSRNWGYDGVYLYGVQHSYGGVQGLKRLVNACHQQGMAVFLDAVYNHFGPEGNYIGCYGPYFTDKYKTPWGEAINFDGAYSHLVRDFFIQNAIYWFRDFHIDALRLDATDHILDQSARHFLRELAEATTAFSQQQGRPYYLTAECDLNNPRWVRPVNQGGFGLDAQWNDEFHHALHALITHESMGYYRDFGSLEQLAKGYTHNFVYTGEFSENRNRFHGDDPSDCSPSQFVVFNQNHDQVGNRILGDRLYHNISLEARKLVAAATLLSPSIPLIFMGEEYSDSAPFQYFVSHGDPDLVEAVRKGRREEFAAFHLDGEAPDPQSEETFQKSKLNWEQRHQDDHQQLWRFYQILLRLRRELPALRHADRQSLEATVLQAEQPNQKLLRLRRWCEGNQVLCWFNFNEQPAQIDFEAEGRWKKLLDSADPEWGGPGTALPDSFTDRTTAVELAAQSMALYSQV